MSKSYGSDLLIWFLLKEGDCDTLIKNRNPIIESTQRADKCKNTRHWRTHLRAFANPNPNPIDLWREDIILNLILNDNNEEIIFLHHHHHLIKAGATTGSRFPSQAQAQAQPMMSVTEEEKPKKKNKKKLLLELAHLCAQVRYPISFI